MENFNKFNLDKEILKALNILNYKKPSEVQNKVISNLLEKNNILVKAKTGTGKSAAFAIPICNEINQLENKLKALIIVPTRELALQVKEEIEQIGRIKSVKCSVILGKEPLKNQILELKQGINVVVATPGRMINHISRGSIDLSNIEYFIIDEVDKMFTKGFENDINTIMKNIPNSCCKSFFSATINNDLKVICDKHMETYKYIEINQEDILKNKIQEKYIKIEKTKSKYEVLKLIFYKFKPNKTIVFTNTKKQAELLYENMKKEGFLVEQIHGDISQERRFYIIDAFKKSKFNILISSDILSRGIHVDDISLVINYDIPDDSEIYVHRIGRTGRAGKSGLAISLVLDNEDKEFLNIQNYINRDIDRINISYDENDQKDYEKIVKNLNQKIKLVQVEKEDEFKGEVVKIHINIGKKKKIRIGDIVGALNNIEGIENSDLGVIKIYDNYSNVDILNKKGEKFLKENTNIVIKNKKAKISKEK